MVGQGLGGNHYPSKAHNESNIKTNSTAKKYVGSERFIERDGRREQQVNGEKIQFFDRNTIFGEIVAGRSG